MRNTIALRIVRGIVFSKEWKYLETSRKGVRETIDGREIFLTTYIAKWVSKDYEGQTEKARRKKGKMFVVEEKFCGRLGESSYGESRSKSQPHLAKSLSSFVGTYLASTLFLCPLPVPLPCPLLGPPLFLFLSLMSGMLRPRHALIGDGLRRPTTAAYARTQLGKCGGEGRGSWVVGRARVHWVSGAMPRRRAPTGNSYSRCPATDFDYHHYSWVDTTSTHLSFLACMRSCFLLWVPP